MPSWLAPGRNPTDHANDIPIMVQLLWPVLKRSVRGYLADNALSRGGAIAYFTIFSIAPVLLIVIAIAGLVFGPAAAKGALVGQLQGTMGLAPAQAIQSMLASAGGHGGGIVASLLGVVMLIAAASGVFGEMQAALNAIWRTEPRSGAIGQMLRSRLASLTLVAALGLLMIASLALSAAIGWLSPWLRGFLPYAGLLLQLLNFALSLAVLAALFAAVYKILPDCGPERRIAWRDALVGGLATSMLFTLAKTGIGLYIGSSQVASGYGAASALVIVMLWIYYSAQIFLFGAEFTKAFADQRNATPLSGASPSGVT